VPVGAVSSPVRAGRCSYKVEVRDGWEIYGTERSEYANGPGDDSHYRFREGDETWTAVSVYLTSDFPHSSDWGLVTQWKEPHAGTPPQQISLQNDVWQIIGTDNFSPRPRLPFGTVQRGVWTDFLVHQRWSSDPSVGFVEVYLNGALALPLTHLQTIEPGSLPLFLSVGYYRDTAPTTGTGILYVDEVRVGTNRASVE
jgi:hypothetical protein